MKKLFPAFLLPKINKCLVINPPSKKKHWKSKEQRRKETRIKGINEERRNKKERKEENKRKAKLQFWV